LTLQRLSDDDVVDGDVDELDEETEEAHHEETDSGSGGNLLELYSMGRRKVEKRKCG